LLGTMPKPMYWY